MDKAYAKLVNNGLEAFDTVKDLHRQGFREEEIYVLAHGENRTDRIADIANANTIGASEEGVIQSVANLFRDRGDQLRAKIEALGFDAGEAEQYEAELDRGKVLVMAKH